MSKLLLELLKVSRLKAEEDNIPKEPEQSPEDGDLEGDPSLDVEDDMDPDMDGEEQPEGDDQGEDDFSDFDDLIDDEDGGDEEMPPEEGEADPEQQGDPNRAGVIRHVKGAHLVYKREQEDGTYEEMWMYNSGEFKNDIETKKAILAGTDIPKNATQSPDGAQTASMWSAGNVDIVVVKGLPQ